MEPDTYTVLGYSGLILGMYITDFFFFFRLYNISH
jgi:hypothetical protein